jgi:hypothetical protein
MEEIDREVVGEDAINGFDFDMEEAEEFFAQKEERENKAFDNRVCICGHPMGRHRAANPNATEISRKQSPNFPKTHECKPNATNCRCYQPRAVLKAEDLRLFLRNTKGAGALHALGQGVISASKKDVKVVWLQDPKCDKCGTEGKVIPVSCDVYGRRKEENSPLNFLLCATCASEA